MTTLDRQTDSLALGLVELIDLISKIRDDSVVLLPQVGQDGLVLESTIVVILLQLGKLSLWQTKERTQVRRMERVQQVKKRSRICKQTEGLR